ncbi:rRNA pseudouridine synthase [Myxococcota bacterium]|nr:rRNA pseudouridine synthase [Myxococcota bacterium]
MERSSPPPAAGPAAATPPVRLHKWLPRCGFGGKRRAEELIRQGRVTVRGEVVAEVAAPVRPGIDRVEVDGAAAEPRTAHTYLLVHKPRGCLTTTRDPEGRRIVYEVLPDRGLPSTFPVGRLDYNTEGALLLTTDGPLARGLLHPSHHVPRTYHVKVRGHLDEVDPGLARFREGLVLHDGPTRPAPTRIVGYRTRATWVEVVLTEGRNRQVRRMCAAVGYQVVKLRRVAIGSLSLGPLPCRAWRFLSPDEVAALYREALGRDPGEDHRLAFAPGDEVALSPRLAGLPGIPAPGSGAVPPGPPPLLPRS